MEVVIDGLVPDV